MIEKTNAENFYMKENIETLKKEFDNSIQMVSITDSPTEELDGIEILVSMAKQGKIDPWNIDIVDITDKYLLHLAETKSNNLRLTGRTLLFAAILLKLKSNILDGLDVMDFEPQREDDFNYDDEMPLDY